MADNSNNNKDMNGCKEKTEMSGENEPQEAVPNSELENFITTAYRQQQESGQLDPTNELNADRAASFYERALAESRRMNAEVEKSQDKKVKLHAELGSQKFEEWRDEHSSQVLTNEQMESL